MNISTWILIITLLLAILFFVIASFLSSDDESKKSAKTGLNGIGGLCITIAFFTGVYKFFTRDKAVAETVTEVVPPTPVPEGGTPSPVNNAKQILSLQAQLKALQNPKP